MKEIISKDILKDASILLIVVVMILSSIVVMADTDDAIKEVSNHAILNDFEDGFEDNGINNGMSGSTAILVVQERQSVDIVLNESFEDPWVVDSDGDIAPPGWENHICNAGSGTLPYHWGQVGTVSFTSGDVVPPDGDYQAMVYWDVGDQDEWLVTPLLDLSGHVNNELTFMFYGCYGSTSGDHYYVKVSPTGGFDQSDFTDTVWDASTEPAGENHYDFPVVINLSAYAGMSIRIAWHDYAIGGLWYAHLIDFVEVTSWGEPPPIEPDLDCNGSLSWTDVEPSSTVTVSFTVENIGDSGSELDWEIESWPDWGTWTFTPDSGLDLTPEDGVITVQVEVVAPDESETEFTGEVKIVNSDDPDDYCIIQVSLATLVNQNAVNSQAFQILQRFMQRFPLLERIIVIISNL